MCYDAAARPPIPTAPTQPADSGPVVLTAADGAAFAGFAARPAQPRGPAVLVLPDNRGLRGFYEQLTVRLAEHGHHALAIDYYGRTAGVDYRDRGADFGDLPAVLPHLGALTAPGLHADWTAAIAALRGPDGAAVVSLGFCLGGRFAFLTAAARFGLAGAIGFYGATDPINGTPGPTQLAAEFTAPILGIFGGADENIPASAVAAFDRALTGAGVAHEVVTYPGAPHGFFDAAQGGHADACADAWRRVLEFLGTHPAPTG